MKLTKSQRSALREKFDGLCAYCGQTLGERWHADHIEPVVRNDWQKRFGFSTRQADHPERHTLDNMNPSCPPCNIDKNSMSIESWRKIIERSNEVLHRDVSTFRRAVRYGLVQVQNKPVVFYFEKITHKSAHSIKE